MSQTLFYPGEIQKLDRLIAAVLQNPILMPALLAHDMDLYEAYGIEKHTQKRLQCIQACSLKEYCQQVHARSICLFSDES